MVAILKIDSNLTGLSYAEEESLGILPATPTWYPLEPNEYTDFGGELSLVARNPINPSRQRKKGVITDLDASGGFSSDFTLTNMQDILQGFFFADLRQKVNFGGAGEITGITAAGPTIDAASGLDAFAASELVFLNNTVSNDGLYTVVSATATDVTVAETLVDETPPALATLTKVGAVTPADDLAVDATGTFPSLTSTVFDFTTLGLIPGEWIFVGGDAAGTVFVNAVNNGYKRVRSVTTNEIIIDKSDETMVTETLVGGETIQIFVGTVLKNELGDNIVRRSYNLERTLGKPDTTDVNDQSEYLVGAVANEFVLNIPTADKMTADLSFVAIDNEQRLASVGPKPGNRPSLVESDGINTSSDFARTRLATVDLDAAPAPLFAFATDLTLTINNNLTPNKAIGVLGAFEVTAGTFTVNGEMTVYLSSVAAVAAVRDNSDITFDIVVWKDNAGVIFDVPLIALGDGRANVEQDAPITLPLTLDAATAAKIDTTLDYTLLFMFFDYLPDLGDIDI